ncbi:hypothetical protein NL676_020795 [Syzygium grande]|nr:hypothetical protein NL676_020795 [Syzygium grande]
MVSSSSMDQKGSIEDNPNAPQPVVLRSNLKYYITTLSIGTRPYAPNMVVDTGSVDTWIPDDEAIQFAEGSPRSLIVNMALRVTSEASDAVTTGVTWSSKATVSIVDIDCIREIDSEKDGTK